MAESLEIITIPTTKPHPDNADDSQQTATIP